jgi:hypothetical protein
MIRWGANRVVILTKSYAFKFPRAGSLRAFLYGMLNNVIEAERGRRGNPGYCPVVFSFAGFLTVQIRAEPVHWESFNPKDFVNKYGLKGVEFKPCSFGKIGEQIVAVDYGW